MKVTTWYLTEGSQPENRCDTGYVYHGTEEELEMWQSTGISETTLKVTK